MDAVQNDPDAAPEGRLRQSPGFCRLGDPEKMEVSMGKSEKYL